MGLIISLIVGFLVAALVIYIVGRMNMGLTVASYGSASGPIEAFNIGLLAQKGSLYATRPTLFARSTRRGRFEVEC